MDNIDLYSLASSPSFCHLMESEEDFTFGAKTSSFLPPATMTNTAANTTKDLDLPDWMEGRELLELPSIGEFKVLTVPSPTLEDTLITDKNDGNTHTLLTDNILMENNYYNTIKPEDMLVPLSELQNPFNPVVSIPPSSPQNSTEEYTHITPPPTPVPKPQVSPPVPKIIICRKISTSALKTKPKPVHVQYKVQVKQEQPQVISCTPLPNNKELLQLPVTSIPKSYGKKPQVTLSTLLSLNKGQQVKLAPPVKKERVQVVSKHCVLSPEESQFPNMQLAVPSIEVQQPCDAEELIDEMVQMIGSSTSANSMFQGMDNTVFDSLEVEAKMEELLFQMESLENPPVECEPHSPKSSAYLSPPPLPESPPYSVSPPPSEISISISSPYPDSTSSFLPSPVPSVGSLSPAQSPNNSLACSEIGFTEDYVEEDCWSPLEDTHSYSRSQRKLKGSSRLSANRKMPYPKDRKERKKEQNKQAALRYRQKKKQEEDDLIGKIEAEEERQHKLTSKYTSLKQELGYLKKIMREMFIARGMLSEEALKKAAKEKKCAK